MAKNEAWLKEVEKRGYQAGLSGKSRSEFTNLTSDEKMFFERGLYRGTIEAARKRQEKREQQ